MTQPTTTNDPTPGWKTSELWLAVLVLLIGAAFVQNGKLEIAMYWPFATGLASVYTGLRTYLKKSALDTQ